jgi:integrase
MGSNPSARASRKACEGEGKKSPSSRRWIKVEVRLLWVWRVFQNAADRAGMPRFGVHTLWHSYRSWLDAVGTELAVQQKLMRHADIRTTMGYGDVVTNQESDALAKITALTLGKLDEQHATARGMA